MINNQLCLSFSKFQNTLYYMYLYTKYKVLTLQGFCCNVEIFLSIFKFIYFMDYFNFTTFNLHCNLSTPVEIGESIGGYPSVSQSPLDHLTKWGFICKVTAPPLKIWSKINSSSCYRRDIKLKWCFQVSILRGRRLVS